jgi:NAD(P)-dependent dehydrogenase (short-subunit alcohol dehydrogenase family)
MPYSFPGKVAFITGGATGIGRAAALQFAAAGAHVAVADVNDAAATETARLCSVAGTRAIAVHVDVRDDAQVAAGVKATLDAFGRLDFALNSAGVGGHEVKTGDYDPKHWDLVIDINLTGVWRSMRHELPPMLAQGSGVIVNVASVAGLNGFPRHPAYAASKHGVVGLSKTAGLEYGRKGVRVNALCPGFTLTPMVQGMIDAGTPADQLAQRVPLGRLGTPEEIAATALWMCSDDAAFMIGHALAVDGGIMAG